MILWGATAIATTLVIGYAGLLWFAAAQVGPSAQARMGLLGLAAIALALAVFAVAHKPVKAPDV
ncbi:MAG: hypothetical protein ACYDCK_13215 [Thermoplasmatota archaeon]